MTIDTLRKKVMERNPKLAPTLHDIPEYLNNYEFRMKRWMLIKKSIVVLMIISYFYLIAEKAGVISSELKQKQIYLNHLKQDSIKYDSIHKTVEKELITKFNKDIDKVIKKSLGKTK